MTPDTQPNQQREKINLRWLVLYLLAPPLFLAVFSLLPAGTWWWARGGLFIGVFVATATLAAGYLWRVNPDVVAARINPHRGTERWDKPWN